MGREVEVKANINGEDVDVEIDIEDALDEATDDELAYALIQQIGFMHYSTKKNLIEALKDDVGFNIENIDDELKMDFLQGKFSKYNWTQMQKVFEEYERNHSEKGRAVVH